MIEGIPAWATEFTAEAALMMIALFAVTGRLLWHRVVERQLSAAEKQRDDALSLLRDALEVNRIHAEAMREVGPTMDRVVDSQEVIVKLVQALPRVDGG